VIQATKGNDHKINIILNKADCVTTQQLMRVYGALMWSLGKVVDTPEVSRVYVGSFWDEPLKNESLRELFEQEENDLYTRLAQLPRSAAVRKVNDLIKRARLAKVHAFLLDYLYNHMPYWMGRDKEKARMLSELPQIYKEIATQRGLPLGDFPDPSQMQKCLAQYDFCSFNPIDDAKMQALDHALSIDLPKLLQMIPDDHARRGVEAAAISQVTGVASPFAVMKVDGVSEQTVYQMHWMVPPVVSEYKEEFESLGPNSAGKVNGQQAKGKMIESKLPSTVLHRVWALADIDKDGLLSLPEYALAMHLIKMKLDGQDLPLQTPPDMLPEDLQGIPH